MVDTRILAGIPFLILIVGALVTKRIIEPAFVSSIAAVVMLAGTDFIPAYGQKMYEVLSDESFQLLIIAGAGFAGMSALLEKSGAMLGFRGILERFCKTRALTLFCTWLLGGIIFIDDYLNALAVSESMKGIADMHKIPREHLAYTVNCMGACVCVMLPVSSWAAFAVACAAGEGMGMSEYLGAIPLMFYPMCAVLICFLLAIGKFPRLGQLKKSYERVDQGGPVLECSAKAGKKEETGAVPSSPLNFVIPMLCLIVGMIVFDQNIVIGMMIALVVMLIMYVAQGKMKIQEFFDTFTSGASTMMPLLITMYLTFIMEAATKEMGFMDYLTDLISRTFPAWSIPVIAFVSVASITFFAASFWALIVISFPIFLPMAVSMGVNPSLVIAAVMSGVALGSQACLYSDAIFMVAAGTEVPNDTQFRTVLPYVLIGAAAAALMFIIAGVFL